VLAMSVDLNEFNVLEKKLPPGQEVVLLDMRESLIAGQPRRGLILHHQAPNDIEPDAKASFIGPELLARIDKLLEGERSSPPGSSFFLSDFRDGAVTGDKRYWGAVERVVDRPADEPPLDTGWLVLVQEPVARQ
jgi:hypothetical protein